MSCSVQEVKSKNDEVNLTGKRAIVVGGTSGIGQGIAERLARSNASVTIVGRNPRGHEILNQLNQLGGKDHEFLTCDSFSMKNIKKFCGELQSKYPQIDYLVLTQGMATIQGRTETEEGIDQKLALHYFGRMQYIIELLPSLRQAKGKVLSVLSAGVHKPYLNYREDFELKSSYSLQNAADSAGFYNDLALNALSKSPGNENILFVHAAPGFVNTRWGTEMPWYLQAVLSLVKPFARTIQDTGEFMCAPILNSSQTGGLVLINQNAELANQTSLQTEESSNWVLSQTIKVLNNATK